jgi:hypothetical protein
MPVITGEFFFNEERSVPGNKVPNPQITPVQRILAIRCMPDRREKVTPTTVILILLLRASAITGAFANPPGGSYVQCDPKNPRSPVRCTPDGW